MTDPFEQRVRDELKPDLELLRLLGRGSVATVYLAREPALKRLVAVKVLRPDVARDETTRRRFEREAQAAARINHPNVTDIYRIGRLKLGVPYIVMEYVDGRNLADTLTARGPMSSGEVRKVIACVADALSAAHLNGIIHRDVRPANIIREDGTDRYVLTDFGIAALLESGGESTTQLTTIGHRIGEPRYMSPEQLNNEAVTEQADIYSLGVLGYELLTGEGPFTGANPGEAIMAQINGQPRRIRDMVPDVESQLATVLERCIARNPDHRPRASEVLLGLVSPSATQLGMVETTGAVSAFINELKRRRVGRLAIGYAVALAAGTELTTTLADTFGLGWLGNVVVILAVAAFPVVLSLAWMYDIREGRFSRATTDPSFQVSTLRRALPWIGLGFSIMLAGLIGWFQLIKKD
jgi:serine/threonine-protein kinase